MRRTNDGGYQGHRDRAVPEAQGFYFAECLSHECGHRDFDETSLIDLSDEYWWDKSESQLIGTVIARAVGKAECPRWELPQTAVAEEVES